jgi:hypothetical protein
MKEFDMQKGFYKGHHELIIKDKDIDIKIELNREELITLKEMLECYI